ncbi:hypothetical protein Hte_011893 [Hypoxylon texense]
MALNPKFAGQRLLFGQPSASAAGVPPAVHTLELFLDYVCPFSAKQFKTVYHTVVPLIKANPQWASSLQLIFRQQVQPWHPSSTLVHEAGVAVLQLAPDKYWAFSDALFQDQLSYFDEAVANETRNDTYRRLAKLGAAVGVDEAKLYDLLAIPDKVPDGGHANGGNKVTNDLKLQIRYARLVSVHVSPTVIFDGVVANDISSSWTKEQWEEWLKKNIAYPERLCVYHAGTGRITFLACLKISTLFIFVFFGFVVTPAYFDKEGLSPTVFRSQSTVMPTLLTNPSTTLSAIVPLLFVAYTTSPFVSFVHLRLPPFARQSEDLLRRFAARKLPPGAELDVTTMSLIAKPRASRVRVADLRRVSRRLGIVNLARDAAAENAARRWYMFRAVADFSAQPSANTVKRAPWVWESIVNRIEKGEV